MSVDVHAIHHYLHDYLAVSRFRDCAPNGLQVEGRPLVKKIVSGVSACRLLIDAAVQLNADAILVHHGYFWRGEDPCIVGMKKDRLRALLQAEVSLLAYHLPLDAHPECGNNAQLAKILGIKPLGVFGLTDPPLAWHGELPNAVTAESFAAHCRQHLQRDVLLIESSKRPLKRIGWCTGAAQDHIEEAARHGLDGFLSGEISERTVHAARELDIHYFCAGHHATERYGVQALGAHITHYFGIEHEFVEIPNPV